MILVEGHQQARQVLILVGGYPTPPQPCGRPWAPAGSPRPRWTPARIRATHGAPAAREQAFPAGRMLAGWGGGAVTILVGGAPVAAAMGRQRGTRGAGAAVPAGRRAVAWPFPPLLILVGGYPAIRVDGSPCCV